MISTVFQRFNKLSETMDYPLKTTMKVERDMKLDSNDNIQINYDIDVKLEHDSSYDEVDWCVTSFENGGDLLEPLFFKQVKEEPGVQCAFCFRYFSDRLAIWKHNLTHLQVTIKHQTLFRCDICSCYFTNMRSIQNHMPKHNKSITDTLSYKPKAYKLSNQMDDELRTLNNYKLIHRVKKSNLDTEDFIPKSFKMHDCYICHKTYTYTHWHAHMQDVHGKGEYTCDICNMVFKCKRYLKNHILKIHMGMRQTYKKVKKIKKSLRCDQCEVILRSKEALHTHRKNVHSDTKYQCHICKSVLKCRSYLLTHLNRVHPSDGQRHKCECGKSFKSKRYLTVHKRNSHSMKNKGKVKILKS